MDPLWQAAIITVRFGCGVLMMVSLLSTIEAHTNLVRALAFSWDKPIFMSVDRKGVLHTWSASTGAQLSTLTLSGHVGWGFALGFTADGTTLASIGWGPTEQQCAVLGHQW